MYFPSLFLMKSLKELISSRPLHFLVDKDDEQPGHALVLACKEHRRASSRKQKQRDRAHSPPGRLTPRRVNGPTTRSGEQSLAGTSSGMRAEFCQLGYGYTIRVCAHRTTRVLTPLHVLSARDWVSAGIRSAAPLVDTSGQSVEFEAGAREESAGTPASWSRIPRGTSRAGPTTPHSGADHGCTCGAPQPPPAPSAALGGVCHSSVAPG